MKVTLFTEYNPSMSYPEALEAYPDGMNACLEELFVSGGHKVRKIVYTEGDDGSALTDEILRDTDVLVWWGHWYHGWISDAVTEAVADYVDRGMGLLALHSAHESKPFRRIVGTSGALSWREIGENERIWTVDPTHPIAKGVGEYIDIEHEEMYGEPFDIPQPDRLVFISWFRGGEVMRSGCEFHRGRGKVFYFRPGHETLPTYRYPAVQKVLLNAVEYLAPTAPVSAEPTRSRHVPDPPEKL